MQFLHEKNNNSFLSSKKFHNNGYGIETLKKSYFSEFL